VASPQRRSLEAYNAKRDFARTPEPAGVPARSRGRRFVVQKHAATRLHYDFRLELDGVLLSWAVAKGPSLDPADKRLAVRTEDHPPGYADFEGTIPKGEYGGGTVLLWDDGRWEPVGDPRAGLEEGKLRFRLDGRRMRGEWVLVRLRAEGRGARENWLLRKVEDEHASGTADLTAENVTSVKSGLGLADIAAGKQLKAKRGTARRAQAAPGFRPVQLATPADEPPAGRQWIHEIKWDGYRALLVKRGGRVAAFTRAGNDWTDRFRVVADAVAALEAESATLDGEVVALDEHGNPSFSRLQNHLKDGGELQFWAFDLLELDGADLAHLPLVERKAKLAPLVAGVGEPLFFSDHVSGDAARVLEAMCRTGCEGIVSKRADSRYVGKRSSSWLKIKCTKRQEFVIGGWSRSEKGRGFASLLLGAHEGGRLRYAGRVGTGFDAATIADLSARMAPLAVERPPFDDLPPAAKRGAVWVKPELVAEVAFAEVTPDGRLRHPSFVALRDDKPAGEVTLDPTPGAELVRAGVAITHPDRVMFPEIGITKRELIDYYEGVAAAMLPHVARRPLSLVRCPQGRGKECFFQKHDRGVFPAGVKRTEIAEADAGRRPYLYVEDVQGLVALLQMGTLEIHVWGSRLDRLECPDRLVIDLDPDVGLGFADVRRAAVEVRGHLAALGLESFPMVTGGKGLHVVAPLAPERDWAAVKDFARRFAEALAADRPDRYTAKLSKAHRRGRIFVDWLRNQRGATAIAPFSTRARPCAPIAVPIGWTQLGRIEGPEWTVSKAGAVGKMARFAPVTLDQVVPRLEP